MQLARPHSLSLSSALIGQPRIIVSIVRLLPLCGPSDISRFVITVVVWKAVDRMLRAWRAVYVGSKDFKRIIPSIVHRNSSATIARIFSYFRIATSVFNTSPDSIKTASGLSVSARSGSIVGVRPLAAVLDGISSQRAAGATNNSSTKTPTPPTTSFQMGTRKTNHCQRIKLLARKIFKVRAARQRVVNDGIFGVGHVCSNPANVIRLVRAFARSGGPFLFYHTNQEMLCQ